MIALSWLFLLTLPCAAKSWNNITPLKTTRAEVIRLLGEPKPFQGKGPEYFAYDNAMVFIKWTRPNCVENKLLINEETAGPDALVYQIRINAKYGSSLNYEKELADFLLITKKEDCVGPRNGSCGMVSSNYGFAYNRSVIGITELQFFATADEDKIWIAKQRPCEAKPDNSVTFEITSPIKPKN